MNCIVIDDDDFSRKIIEKFVGFTDFLHLVGSYSNAIMAINDIKKKDVDLIFLDIEMPEMTGLEFLKSLNKKPQVIIISSKKEYAFDAFDFDVVDYVLKPVEQARLYKAINKAHDKFQEFSDESVSSKGIFVKHNNVLVRVDFDEIIWIEAMENYVVVNTNCDKYTVLSTMKSILEKLPENTFLRVHRSYIVNVSHVKMIEDNSIIFKLQKETKLIPVAKSYKSNLLSSINLINK